MSLWLLIVDIVSVIILIWWIIDSIRGLKKVGAEIHDKKEVMQNVGSSGNSAEDKPS